MRILFFSRSYTVHDHRFLEALGNSGHEILFLYLEVDPVTQEKRPIPSGVTVLDWPRSINTQCILENPTSAIEQFRTIVDKVHPDIVHAGPVPTCGYLAAIAKSYPLMLMSWGSDLLVDADRNQCLHDRTCFALRRSEMLIADCAEVAGKAQQLTGYPTDRIVQFPWGVDLDSFRPGTDEASLRQSFPEKRFILLSTRGWEKSYGTMHLLRGFRAAHSVDRSLSLFLLGGGSLRAEIETFISGNDLLGSILMPGQISASQLPHYYRASDLYISCTFSDGTSISLLEAMASGLPVIATNRASNREWIQEGVGGLLVPFGDESAICEAILHFSKMGEAERQSFGHQNLAVAKARGNWKSGVGKLLAAYEELVKLKAHEHTSR
jgi:glycosyltransferase involved in cell wall biosynthesis